MNSVPRTGATSVLNQWKPSRASVRKYLMTATEQTPCTNRMPSTPSSGLYVPSFSSAASVLESSRTKPRQ